MKHHEVHGITFEDDTLVLAVDGAVYRVPLSGVSGRLSKATEVQRKFFRVSPSGYGVHWPELDEDLSVDGLIRIARGEPETAFDASALRETHE